MDPWSRGREVACGVQRSSPKPEKRPIFGHRRGIENFCRLFSTQQHPNVHVSNAWLASATYHRSFCEHCDQRVGRSPSQARPVQIINTSYQKLPFGSGDKLFFHGAVVGFVDRCLSRTRNLAASNKHLAEFFSGRSWPKIGPGTIFSGFLKSLIFSLEDLRYYNLSLIHI